jgi:hypothetical protein
MSLVSVHKLQNGQKFQIGLLVNRGYKFIQVDKRTKTTVWHLPVVGGHMSASVDRFGGVTKEIVYA